VTSAVKYLLDTDICIYLLNGDERVKSRVAQAGVDAISVSILNNRDILQNVLNLGISVS
jgi:predicted nucleic acid-binding protein